MVSIMVQRTLLTLTSLMLMKSSMGQFSFNPDHPLLQGLFYGLAPGLGSQYVPGGRYRSGMYKPFTTKAHTFPIGSKKGESEAMSIQRPMYSAPASMYPMYGSFGRYGLHPGTSPTMYGPQMRMFASSNYAPSYAPSPYGGMYQMGAFSPQGYGHFGSGHFGSSGFGSSGHFGSGHFGSGHFGSGHSGSSDQLIDDEFNGGHLGNSYAESFMNPSYESLDTPLTTIHEEDGAPSLSPSPADHQMAAALTKSFKSKSGLSIGGASGSSKPPISFSSEESFLNSKFSPSDIYKRLDKLITKR